VSDETSPPKYFFDAKVRQTIIKSWKIFRTQLKQEQSSREQIKQKLDENDQELRVTSKSCEHLQRELETLRSEARTDLATANQESDR